MRQRVGRTEKETLELLRRAVSAQVALLMIDPCWHAHQCQWKRPAWNLPAQHRSYLALKQLECGAVLSPGQAVAIGVYMEHLVSHLLVVPKHLVDDLLRAADQG